MGRSDTAVAGVKRMPLHNFWCQMQRLCMNAYVYVCVSALTLAFALAAQRSYVSGGLYRDLLPLNRKRSKKIVFPCFFLFVLFLFFYFLFCFCNSLQPVLCLCMFAAQRIDSRLKFLAICMHILKGFACL